MTIEQRIRKIAASKIKVRITGRTRSRGGFYVHYPIEKEAGTIALACQIARTKREALAVLVTKLRCMPEMELEIKVRPFHRGDK